MQVYYAPARALEKEFLAQAAALKPGPERGVLILCPSGRVAERLRRKLARQSGLISNVHFKTFGQLLAELDKETPGRRTPLLPGDNLHDYLLKNLLLRPGLDRYRTGRGFITALRASLRDLADALAEPEVLEEHLLSSEDPYLQNETEHLRWLIQVYRAYTQGTASVPGYRSYKQYFEQALSAAENSAYLHQFKRIFVYGFYELTGRQLELFNVLRGHYPMTVFWLYAKHPAFAFGRKFFEANLLGASTQVQELEPAFSSCAAGPAAPMLFQADTAEQTPQGLHFISAPDPQGELFFAAKEMLRLHEEEGISYADMALTARSLEPYKTYIPDLFEQNAIPLQADFTFGLSARPLGVFIRNVLELARGGFERSCVLAVVTSPYFKIKNNWRYLIDECLAERDFAQWTDLVTPALHFYDPDFWGWLAEVRAKLAFLERPLEWQTLLTAVQDLLQSNTNTDIFNASEQALWSSAMGVLASFARYGAVSSRAREGEFLDELFAALQTISLHQTADVPGGVSVLDALALRGLDFKVVFMLGMNEKSFPLVIREDPVLKDYYRRVLRDQLGFWINQKMERFDEEKLLFFNAVQSASDKLYLSFLRADAEGKPLVPSGYLAELARAARVDLAGPAVHRVSGRLSERIKQIPLKLLNEKELSLLLAVQGADKAAYQEAGLWTDSRQTLQEAARELASFGALNARDGAVETGEEIFASQDAGGFSPSALQDLARCPMKYFLSKGIGLREKDEVLSRAELAPNARGTAYHEILMDYYQSLYKEGLAGQLFDAALTQRLDRALDARYDAKSYKRFGIYPVIWELILQDMREKLSAFVTADAQQLGGFVPSVFETYFEKVYHPSAALKLKLKGIIDRIDIDASARTFRVLDYKSSKHGGKDLTAEMFKRVILQPFIYLILAQHEPQTQGLLPDGAALLGINKGYERQELPQAGFETIKERADAFLTLLMNIVRGGRFFINPGEHCEYCAYAAICRKDAFRSRVRARHTPQARELEEAKQ